MDSYILALLTVLIASILQSTIGFGFAIVATPLLLLIYESRACIQISIFLSFLIAVILLPKIKKEIYLPLLKKLILGCTIGVPVGIIFFMHISLYVLKTTVSVVVTLITVYLIFKWYQRYVNTKKIQVIKDNNCKFIPLENLIGFLSGALITSIGMPGVPLALYFNSKNASKEITRGTTLAFL